MTLALSRTTFVNRAVINAIYRATLFRPRLIDAILENIAFACRGVCVGCTREVGVGAALGLALTHAACRGGVCVGAHLGVGGFRLVAAAFLAPLGEGLQRFLTGIVLHRVLHVVSVEFDVVAPGEDVALALDDVV